MQNSPRSWISDNGGAWSHDGAEGFYRAVVYGAGIEHQRHWLYLQWLEIDHGTQKFHLVHTEPVKEINALAGHYVLRLDVTFPAVNVMRIAFQATESHTMEVRNGVVSAGSARQYSFKWVKK
jgi:hypothetical protein